MTTYISSWQAFISNPRHEFDQALTQGTIQRNDIVWAGPSGDFVIASDPAELDEEYADYIDAGTVKDYLADED